MSPEEQPPWLQFLSFGDSGELRFPLVLMGVAIVAFVSILELVDGWQRHLDHLIPFGGLILAALAFRAWLVRQHPQPLGPG